MNYTNNHNLPKYLCKILSYSTYDINKVDFKHLSASELTDPIKLIILKKRHPDNLTMDISGMTKIQRGTAIHLLCYDALKNDDDYILEKRYKTSIEGITVSGKFDAYEISTKTLIDHKSQDIYKFKNYPYGKFEYILQLNIYKYLFELNTDYMVERLVLDEWILDHRRYESFKDIYYPELDTHERPIKIWTKEKIENYLTSKIKEYKINLEKNDDDIEPCNDRWGDKRCKDYCTCNMFCSYYKDKYGSDK